MSKKTLALPSALANLSNISAALSLLGSGKLSPLNSAAEHVARFGRAGALERIGDMLRRGNVSTEFRGFWEEALDIINRTPEDESTHLSSRSENRDPGGQDGGDGSLPAKSASKAGD